MTGPQLAVPLPDGGCGTTGVLLPYELSVGTTGVLLPYESSWNYEWLLHCSLAIDYPVMR